MMRSGWLRSASVVLLSGLVAASSSGMPGPVADGLAALRQQYRRVAAVTFPDDNPFSEAKRALGQRLFFDPALSRSGTMSCASCHQAALGWGDGRALAVGDVGQALPLRSPTLLEIASLPRLGWDGKFDSIEVVAAAAVTGPANMNLPVADLMARLAADPSYVDSFTEAFGQDGMTFDTVEQALATFERTITAGSSPFDRWVEGDPAAIGEAAVRGFVLFNGRAGCSSCHGGPALTDGSFQDIGVAGEDDLGRGTLFPSSAKLRHAFKTPTLRDIAHRAPFMHDGSIPTLAAVIDHYDAGGIDRPSRSVLIRPLGLSAAEKADLLSFLQTLSAEPDRRPVPPNGTGP